MRWSTVIILSCRKAVRTVRGVSGFGIGLFHTGHELRSWSQGHAISSQVHQLQYTDNASASRNQCQTKPDLPRLSSTASFSHIHDYCPQKCTIFSISQGASRSLKSIGMWRKKKDAFPIVAGILKLLVEILQRESAPGRSCWKPAKSLKDRLCSWGESACWSHHREFICMHPLVKWAGASWMLSDAATITHHNLLIECSQWYSRDCFVL